MWPNNSIVVVLLALIVDSILAASIINNEAEHHVDNVIADITGDVDDQLVVEGRGKLRRAILPLMLGIILKVGSIVPMKLMIMAFFAIISLLTSKFALLIAAAVGLFHHKSASSQNQRFAIGEPYNLPVSGHAVGASAFPPGGPQFSSFASGEGAADFDLSSSSPSLSSSSASFNADSTVFSAHDPKLGHKRRRVIIH